MTLDQFEKQQAETKKKLAELTGAKAVKVLESDFKGMAVGSTKKGGETTSDWSTFETGSKKSKSKNRKEKKTLVAGFKIKDEGYEPRERRGGRGGSRGGRGGRGGSRGGRGGMAARLDSASDFPSL